MPYYNLASALINEVLIALMQNHVMDCLNERLILNGYRQQDSFEETITSCFDASLIDMDTCYACIAITHKGNKAIHDATAYLMATFGPP
jgi:hypothetical protein